MKRGVKDGERTMQQFNWRSRIAVLGALVLVAAGALACTPETNVTVSPGGTGQPGISVTGEGSVFVASDLARLNLGVHVTDESVAAARDRAATAMAAVIAAVEDAGVDEDDIRTTQFNISPQYRYTEERGEEITGYQVTNIVTVTVRDLDSVSEVIDSAAAAGGDAVRVENIQFTVEDREQFVGDARTEALENARTHAEQLAEAAGVTLGAPISIVESGDSMPPPSPRFTEDAARQEAGADTPISPGEQQITIRVQVVYAIAE